MAESVVVPAASVARVPEGVSLEQAATLPMNGLTVVARRDVSLARILEGEEMLCSAFDRCLAVSHYLLDQAPSWL